MKASYFVQDIDGKIIYEGSVADIAVFLGCSFNTVNKAKNEGKKVKNRYRILHSRDEKPKKKKLVTYNDHLFYEDGRRKYEYKKGGPNRFKGPGGVRFTPL